VIPDEIKNFALELHNIRGLMYVGYPIDKTAKTTPIPTNQLLRIIHLERRFMQYLDSELGALWEMDYSIEKQTKRTADSKCNRTEVSKSE